MIFNHDKIINNFAKMLTMHKEYNTTICIYVIQICILQFVQNKKYQ